MAINRKKNDIIIAAATGTAYSGKQGTTANTLPASQQIAVDYVHSGASTNSGLTLAKLVATKRILMENDVDTDDEELFFVYAPQQLADLLNNVDKVQSSDYNQVKALYEGKINYFMGMTFIRTTQLSLDSSDYRTCFAYCKSGLQYAENMSITTHVDVLPLQSHATQVRSVINAGAVRMEEEKVVSVVCDESV